MLIFVDDLTRFTRVYYVKERCYIFSWFMKFREKIIGEFDRK